MPDTRPCIGLVPAAGRATRLGPLPCSKEILPLPPGGGAPAGAQRVIADCLLEAYRIGGIKKVFIILREGKWDIPGFYGDGHRSDLHLAYLITRYPYGTPFTLDQAYPFVRNANVALGFPDVQFRPRDVFPRLLQRLGQGDAEVVLGLFPTPNPSKADMVDCTSDGRVRDIVIKPARTSLRLGWFCAVWTPRFSIFMHDWLARAMTGADLRTHPEIYVGTVMRAALTKDMPMAAETFPEGKAVDVGTPEDLARAATW